MAQYRNDKAEDSSVVKQMKEAKRSETKQLTTKFDPSADYFGDYHHATTIFHSLNNEYSKKITPSHVKIQKEKNGYAPYWDDEKCQKIKLPNYQHNESSGRFQTTMEQVSLSYNSFFPNQSYGNSLIDLDIIEPVYDDDGKIAERNRKQVDKSRLFEQGFDNLIRFSQFGKCEHLHMVAQMLCFGVGVYYFPDSCGYEYKSLDFRKMRFPIGTSVKPKDWEYFYLIHDKSWNDLIKTYQTAKKVAKDGWDKDQLGLFLHHQLEGQGVSKSGYAGHPNDKVETMDSIHEGLRSCDLSQTCNARTPLVSLFWRGLDNKVSQSIFALDRNGEQQFLYHKKFPKTFGDMFSTFVYDQTATEIRAAHGVGRRIFTLSHAYERQFSRVLDAAVYSSTLFVQMDTDDLRNQIVNMGTLNVGKFDSIQNFKADLQSQVAFLAFLEGKIQEATSTRGLNKLELFGEKKGESLSDIALNVEGRVVKHRTSGFIDSYSEHFKKVLARVLEICKSKGKLASYPEVESKFHQFLLDNGCEKKDLIGDDNSDMNHGLPSTWMVVARKPDGMGIRPSSMRQAKDLLPLLSSIPDEGRRLVISNIIADAFGDESMAARIAGDGESLSGSEQHDQQLAETQVMALTSEKSDFDYDLSLSAEIVPELSDGPKFNTLNAFDINSHKTFAAIFLAKVDDVKARFERKEIGITTLHIWLFNLLTTTRNHLDLMESDQIENKTPEYGVLKEKFDSEFSNLRFVERRANTARDTRIKQLQKKLQEQDPENPKTLEAQAKLLTAQARVAEVEDKKSVNRVNTQLKVQKNRRAEENHFIDQRTKFQNLVDNRLEKEIQLNSVGPVTQSNRGRPGPNNQTVATSGVDAQTSDPTRI